MRTHRFIATGAVLLVTGGGVALATTGAGAHSSGSAAASAAAASRLDDGKDLLPRAGISEQQAIAAAQGAASGQLNEVDLEHAAGRLVFNVDVGNRDVEVDAATGDVVRSGQDD
jgi:uncharacterized membrane protein YkoI